MLEMFILLYFYFFAPIFTFVYLVCWRFMPWLAMKIIRCYNRKLIYGR